MVDPAETSRAKPPYRQIDEIPGWFQRMDMEVFRQLLEAPSHASGAATWPSSAPTSARAPR